MEPLPSFVDLVQPLSVAMTAPTFASFQVLVMGWLLARRCTLTGMLRATGRAETDHHARFHRVFSGAAWAIDTLGLAVFEIILAVRDPRGVLWLSLDDTHNRKRGTKVFGAAMLHDPLFSTRARHVATW